MDYVRAIATVVQGQRLASGTATVDPSFNADGGTIKLQAPGFTEQGLDLSAFFGDVGYVNGTLNLLLEGLEWQLGRDAFEYHMRDVRWTDKLDKDGKQFRESFFLSPCRIEFEGQAYPGLIYIPDPLTKPDHHAPLAPYIDVIAPLIPGIGYGSKVVFSFNPDVIVTKKT